MWREEIRKRRASQRTRKRRASQQTSQRGRRESPQGRKASQKRKRRKMSKQKRSGGVNWRWLTVSLRTSTGKGRSSQELPYIVKDVCAPPFFWQGEIICLL